MKILIRYNGNDKKQMIINMDYVSGMFNDKETDESTKEVTNFVEVYFKPWKPFEQYHEVARFNEIAELDADGNITWQKMDNLIDFYKWLATNEN